MLPDKIMQSDILDILFENRNKNYGAYALRKSYNKTIKASITTTVFISACFAVIVLMHHNKEILISKTIDLTPDPTLSSFKTPDSKPQVIVHPKAINNVRTINNSAPVIAHNDDAKTTQPSIDDIDKSIISNITANGKDAGNIVEAPPSDFTGNGQSTAKAIEPVINDAPLTTAEVMPQFPGGVDALVKFIQRNIKQPDDLDQGQSIKVMASFIVTNDGSIQNIKIINSGRADLDKEVMRVIHKMPLWKPGMQNGKAVAVYFNLPVTFQSAED